MKFLPTLLFSLSVLIIPLSAHEQTFSFEQAVSQDVNKQLLCMAKNIYYEAASESFEGKLAVAQVTMNRVNSKKFPSNVCDVVYQRGSYSAKKTIEIKVGKGKKKRTEEKEITKNWTVCQFSWTCERVKPPSESDPRYVKIKELVDEFSNGGYPEYREKYAKSYHYHAYYVNPRWKLNRLHRVGAHIFYD